MGVEISYCDKLYIQGMWSVLCVPYVGGGISYSDHHKECTYRTCGQWYAFHILVVGFSIVIGLDLLDI